MRDSYTKMKLAVALCASMVVTVAAVIAGWRGLSLSRYLCDG